MLGQLVVIYAMGTQRKQFSDPLPIFYNTNSLYFKHHYESDETRVMVPRGGGALRYTE